MKFVSNIFDQWFTLLHNFKKNSFTCCVFFWNSVALVNSLVYSANAFFWNLVPLINSLVFNSDVFGKFVVYILLASLKKLSLLCIPCIVVSTHLCSVNPLN